MGNISYDYDEVIRECTNCAPDVESLFNRLLSFSHLIEETQDNFHGKEGDNNLNKIYKGFSNIIGSTNEVVGLGGIGVKSKNIIDIIYTEALNDKAIVEGEDSHESDNYDYLIPSDNKTKPDSEITTANIGKYIDNYKETMIKIQNNTQLLDTMIDFFRAKGLDDYQVAGIVGNACRESGLVIDAQNPESSAHGLFQWLKDRYPSDWSVESQLNHAWNEMAYTRYNGQVLTRLDGTSNATAACDSFRTWFEGGDASSKAQIYSRGVLYYMENVKEI